MAERPFLSFFGFTGESVDDDELELDIFRNGLFYLNTE